LCYRYTIPQRIAEQFQLGVELSGIVLRAGASKSAGGRALFYPHAAGFGKPLHDGFPTRFAPAIAADGRPPGRIGNGRSHRRTGVRSVTELTGH
jgi:hypothetical protein